jgi:hypothetical protein
MDAAMDAARRRQQMSNDTNTAANWLTDAAVIDLYQWSVQAGVISADEARAALRDAGLDPASL